MVIIKIEMIPIKSKRYKNRLVEQIILECDQCKKEYIPPYYSKNRAKKLKHHFCSVICSRKSSANGILRDEMKKTCLEKYGSEIFAASQIGRQIINNTMISKYGVISAFSLPEIRTKIKETNLERYGVKKVILGQMIINLKLII